jgi:hypothetical protein
MDRGRRVAAAQQKLFDPAHRVTTSPARTPNSRYRANVPSREARWKDNKAPILRLGGLTKYRRNTGAMAPLAFMPVEGRFNLTQDLFSVLGRGFLRPGQE